MTKNYLTTPQWQPFNIEAEQALLGAILINNDAYTRVSEIVQSHHFHEPLHQLIMQNAGKLIDAGRRADPVTMKSMEVDVAIGEGLTLSQYLARLAAEATTVVNAPDYAKTVRELADRRSLTEVAYLLTPNDATGAVDLATDAISALDAVVTAHASSHTAAVNMAQGASRAVDAAAKAYQNDGHISGVATGIEDLDRRMHGLSEGDLVVLAGRPGMGKSALAVHMLRRMAEEGAPCLMFSLEMGDIQLVQRMMSDLMFDGGQVPYSNLRSGNFHQDTFNRIRDAGHAIAKLPITIEQQPGLTVAQISARARQFKRRYGLRVMVIDHLDLIRPSGRYAGNKVYELGEITAALKALAKELGIVVILLSQLSREVEKRDDKRPMLSDLRSSGSIEQDADSVIMLYRPSYYLEQRDPPPGSAEYEAWQTESANAINKLIVVIAKQRAGSVGNVELFCNIASNAIRPLNR